MDYKEKNGKYFVRLNRGEEIVSTLKKFCEKENIKAGFIAGIGAVDSVTLGYFNPETKAYNEETINDFMEVTSLLGNISEKDDKPYLHLHINLSSSDYNTIGGHLIAATISLTSEICINKFNEKVDRKFDSETGINLLSF